MEGVNVKITLNHVIKTYRELGFRTIHILHLTAAAMLRSHLVLLEESNLGTKLRAGWIPELLWTWL
jgi:hypothetical protein